jgi:hypothetical protein
MNSRVRCSILIVVSACVAIACASEPPFDVSATFDPLAPFPAQATFAWNDSANRPPDNPELESLDYDRLLKQVGGEEFSKRGYSLATQGLPDYWLSYELTVYSWFSAEKTQATGTLSLSLVDANSDRRIWLGYGRAEVLVGLNEAERIERLREILTGMLANFPPNQRGDFDD